MERRIEEESVHVSEQKQNKPSNGKPQNRSSSPSEAVGYSSCEQGDRSPPAPAHLARLTPASETTTTMEVTTCRLYIGNLHPRVTQVHLESLLKARSLAAEHIQFIRKSSQQQPSSQRQQQQQQQQSHQYAFVTLPSTGDAVRAIQLLHGRKLLGKNLVVQPAHAAAASSSLLSGTTAVPIGRERQQLDQQIHAIRQKLKQQHATKG